MWVRTATNNMASADDMNIKTFHDVRAFLTESNDSKASKSLPPKPGAFMLISFPMAPKNNFDLVFEGIYLGDASIVKRTEKLKAIGVTHVVNVSKGTKINQTDTDVEFYQPHGIDFHGIPAVDIMTYKMLPHLKPAADFIHQARQKNGVVYVHCQQGVSRSATVVLAYLMYHYDMPLLTAVKTIRQKREIFPNEGFLKQLCVLDKQLQSASPDT